MNSENLIALINLLNVPRIGPQKVRGLVTAFPEANNIFSLSQHELCSVEGIDLKSAEAIRSYKDFDYGKIELEKSAQQNINLLSFWGNDYPLLLRKIFDPPVLLYSLGKPLQRKEDCLAVVGTRTTTQYGRNVTKNLIHDLVSNGLTIVSGLARGIDSVAHKETVKTGGRTIAVMGSGLDVVYPPENRRLFDEIQEKGSVISEFSLGTKPDAGNFPQRNRIISGISHGTIVVEAGDKSGAILTALNAVDQNREVFAVPGRINDKQSVGCLRLIRNGAIPVQNGNQVLQHIESRMFKPLSPKQQQIVLDLTPPEIEIINKLSNEPVHVDALAKICGISISQLLTVLLELELKGAVQQLSGKQFIRAI